MRTKTQQEKFNWKALLLTYVLFLIIFVLLKVCVSFFNPIKQIDLFWFLEQSYWLIIYPMLMASILINNFRKASITIGDFHSIPDFSSKLLQHLEKNKIERVMSTEAEIQYLPTAKFRRLFKNWFDAERLTVSFSPEMIHVTGPVYRISQLDDTLKWNKDFKI